MKTTIEDAISYRKPMRICEVAEFLNGHVYPRCPRCKITMERDYQAYCDRCGQCLDWRHYSRARIIKFSYD